MNWRNQWQPIETAPRDGQHIRGAILDGGAGFGWWNGRQVPAQTTVHYWAHPGEEGFYTSVNEAAPQHPWPATHWQPLEPRPLDVDAAAQWLIDDDTAYAAEPDSARRAARHMLSAAQGDAP